MNNSKKYLFLIVMILFVVIGVSLAYFGITIIGNDTAKGNNVVTGNLELTFNDTNELIFNGAFPGDYITKTISVKNTGTKEVSYNLVWTKLTNEITNNELVIEATCKRLNSSGVEEGTCNSISQTPISDTTIKKNISIEPSVTHEYNITITFIDTGKPQNYNKNKTFEGKLGINESAVKTVYCTFNGELKQGAEYVKGKFTYHYKEKGYDDNTNRVWSKISDDGWGVMLTLPTSTAPIDASEICTYINDKPIVSMSGTFYTSKATSINLSKLDTSNVIYMDSMFIVSHATTLDLSNFDTSNVTDMHSMFVSSQASTIDLSNFDTSNVTDMHSMFASSQATTIDLSNFDTSNVTDMHFMFASSQATTIDLSSFNTSNVTNLSEMFYNSKATTLDLSSFNTSNVTNMNGMFYNSQATEIKGLDKFNTSNVTNMAGMFTESHAAVLDLSSFNTSKVTDMMTMFAGSQATTIKGLENFDTSNVEYMLNMFSEISVTTLNLSSFNTSNVNDMTGMFSGSSNLKTIYASDQFDIGRIGVEKGSDVFTDCVNLVGGAGTTYDEEYTDYTYAHIDGGIDDPGYFTAK